MRSERGAPTATFSCPPKIGACTMSLPSVDAATMDTISPAFSVSLQGITTQDDELAARFDPIVGGRKIANYLRVLTLETQTLARACGKSHVHNLEPEDLVALTVEAAAMARVPLAGTDWIPGLAGS